MEKIDVSARNKDDKTGTLRISDPALADCRSRLGGSERM